MQVGVILRNGKGCLAVARTDGAIMDASVALTDFLSPGTVPNIKSVITEQTEARAFIERAAGSDDVVDAINVRWLPTEPSSGKVLCNAPNNSVGVERIVCGPKPSAFFPKRNTSLVGHRESITLHPPFGRAHPEPERFFVMGRRGCDSKIKSAHEYVFDRMIMNDLTSAAMSGDDLFYYRRIYP